MWNPYRQNYLPPSNPTQTPPEIPLPPSLPSNPSSWPYYTPPVPMYPRQTQAPSPMPPPCLLRPLSSNYSTHNSHFQQNPSAPLIIDLENDSGPTIKIEDRLGHSENGCSLPDPTYLPTFLPPPRPSNTPYLPPMSSCTSNGVPTLPPFPSHAYPEGPRFLEPPPCPAMHHPRPQPESDLPPSNSSQTRKRQREQSNPSPQPTHLPPMFASFPPTHSPYINNPPPAPNHETRQYNAAPASSAEDDNRNKRQRLSVVTTTSVRSNANRLPGLDVATTTTTTTTISTATTTTRSVSTTTTTTSRGPSMMSTNVLPSLSNSFFGTGSPLSNPAAFMSNIVNRLRQDPRQFPPMHPHPHDQDPAAAAAAEGWGTGRAHESDEDVRVAFDELRNFLSRSSSLLSPFLQFRARGGHAHDDEDDDDDDEEEEEAISFDQMNLPEITYEEGVSSGNEKLCVICQDEYKTGEKLSSLPCVHHFHTSCIKKWVDECKPECPLCKSELA